MNHESLLMKYIFEVSVLAVALSTEDQRVQWIQKCCWYLGTQNETHTEAIPTQTYTFNDAKYQLNTLKQMKKIWSSR